MASNKDILEAQRFNRRRLVAAFSSGTPGGRELETSSGMRPFLIGAIISIVMLIVALVMGRFAPTLPEGWQNATTIVVSSTGARYYTINGVLRPVANITSAKLLSESGNYQVSRVSASTIEGIARGTRIGLDDAPDDVPESSALHSDQWTACTIGGRTRTWVAQSPEGLADAPAALVKNNNVLYLVVGGTRHRIDDSTNSGVLLALRLDSTSPIDVSADWLDLFERGSDLAALDVDQAGTPVTGMPSVLSSAVIGTVIEVEDDSGTSAREYIVVGDRKIAPLTNTTARLYRISNSGALAGNPLKAKVGDLASLEIDTTGIGSADWPESISAVIEANDAPCASLVLSDDGASSHLMTLPASSTNAASGNGDTPDTKNVNVKGGSGALIRATSGGDLGVVIFVSDSGLRHGLGTDPSDSLARLGWKNDDVVAIPSSWTALIPEGISLTSEAAWATVAVQ